jgi:shikimate dehydrogenase
VGEPRVGGATRVAAVLGWPVAHSLSPVIHNAAFAALEMDWTYVALPVEPGAVPTAVAGLRSLGFAGANVTMPHKEAVAASMDELTEDAERLRAVNTIEMRGDRLVGHNTDAPGFARFLERDAGFDPAGKTALVFGAGGAARACALAVARAGLTRIVVALREPARAAPLAAAVDGLPTVVETIGFDAAADATVDLVVNATPLGAHGEALPLPTLGADGLFVDLLYRPAVTPAQQAARAAGAQAFGGLGLLLHQAALAFELWSGRPAPLEVMSAAAVAALAEPA